MTNTRDTLTLLGAIVGSASGLGSAYWHVANWLKDRLNLRVGATIGYEPAQKGTPLLVRVLEAPGVSVSLANHGRREIFVATIGITKRDGDFPMGERFPLHRIPTGLPRWLKEGESCQIQLHLGIVSGDAMGLYAVDGRGKKWSLPRRRFLDLQTAARRELAKQNRDAGMTEIAADNRAVPALPDGEP